MGRDNDTRQDRDNGVFRTSRRVTFVVRSVESQRRLSMSRVSRDPMTSMKVDVRESPPRPPSLGVGSDWSAVSGFIEGIGATPGRLTAICTETDDCIGALVLSRGAGWYLYHPEDQGEFEFQDSAFDVRLDRDLYELLRDRRAVVVIDRRDSTSAKLVSYKSFASAKQKDAVASPPASSKALEPASAAPIVEPVAATAVAEQPAETAPTTAPATGVASARLRALTSPKGFPDSLQESLSKLLSQISDRFGHAMLLQVEYDGGHLEYLIGFAGAPEHNHAEIEAAVNAALAASRRKDIELGIAFLEPDDPMLTRISRVAQFMT